MGDQERGLLVRRGYFRACLYCHVGDVWDRSLALDADGNVTMPPNAHRFLESRICLTCNQVQPMGPATIMPAVAIEVRAAELSDLAASHATSAESQGWRDFDRDRDPLWSDALHDGWSAGWLGRAINTHQDSNA